jgi:hypothetical protein
VRELANSAEDVVWKRLRGYSVFFGALLTCVLGFLTFAGLNTLNSVSTKVEPLVSAAEKRAQAAKQTIDETAGRVDSVRTALNRLSKDVDEQTRRVGERSGELSRKLEGLESAAQVALRQGETYRKRSEDLARNVDQMTKSLEVRVAQVSKQVDNLAIRQAYPSLGEKLHVTYAGQSWKGLAGKSANEKWVNISILYISIGNFGTAQVEALMNALKSAGYTPFLGTFGVDGPYASQAALLGDSAEATQVFYFKRESERMADGVCAIVSGILPFRDLKPKYVDPTAFSKEDPRRFILEQSGVDIQILLR